MTFDHALRGWPKSASDKRNAIIVIHPANLSRIIPIPITAGGILRCTGKLGLGDARYVAAQAGIVFERLPGQRVIIVADSQEPTKTKNGNETLPLTLSIITRSIEPIGALSDPKTAVPSTLALPIRLPIFVVRQCHGILPVYVSTQRLIQCSGREVR